MFQTPRNGVETIQGNNQIDARNVERACAFEQFRSGTRLFVDMTPAQKLRVIEQAFELQEEECPKQWSS